jgi:outer membrane protein assembly factor BamB
MEISRLDLYGISTKLAVQAGDKSMLKKVCYEGSTVLSMNKALNILRIVALLIILTGIAQADELSWYPQDPASTGNTNECFSGDLELLWLYNISKTVWDVSISSDGEYIAAGCFDDTVYFFNREGKLLWQYKTGTIVTSVSISSDGEYIAAGSASHSYISEEYGEAKVYLFNREGKLLWSYEPDGSSVDKVSISSDGNYIVAGVEGYPSKLYVFNKKGKLLWSREDIDPDDTSISSDGSYVATSCCDQEVWGVCLFNKDGKLLWRYEVYGGGSVSVSADGSYVTAGSDGKVYFFNRAGKLLWSYQHPEQREKYLFSIDVDAELEEDLKKGIFTERLENIFKTKGIPLDVNIISAIKNNWDTGEYSIRKEKGKIDFYRRYSGMYIYYTWISSDGNYVAAKTCGKLYFFNKDGELLWSFQTEGDPGSIWRGISISSDGSYVVVGNYGDDHHYDGNLYFFNRNGGLLGEYKTNTSVESASISSDGSYVAVGTFNRVYCFSTNVPDIGYAVLVAGDDDGFFDRKGINNNANTAYRALKSRGFDDERILYLNSRTPQDADGDGDIDVDKPSSFKDFEDAIEWARERVGEYSPFILYLVGHCDGNSFYLNDVDTISPGFRLDHWLGELPTGTRMLIVIDSCYAGSFITPPNGDISAINRIIIGSSGDHSVSDTILYSGSLFSQKFWQYLGQGRNVKEAFVEGTKDANHIGMLAGKYWDPWLDDNGDAVGHSPLFLGDDGAFAATMKIGVPGATPSVGEGAPNRQLFEDCYDRTGGSSILGYPVNRVHRWGNGYIQDFQGGEGYGGAIMHPDGINYAYAIYGSIWSKYLALGGAEGALGYPSTDELEGSASSITGARCRYNKFKGGAIVHRKASGSYDAKTVYLGWGIFNKWEELTYGESALGLPTSDEREAHQSGAEGFDTTGVVCDFEGGHIYWRRTGEYKDKAFEVHGAIDGSYQNEGGSGSWLGFPISDEYKDSSAGYARSDFEGGYITTPDGINYHAYPYELPQQDLAVTQWKIETVDSQGDVGLFTSLAINGDDNPAISYYDSTNHDLKYAYWNGDNWNIETVDNFGNIGWPTSLAFDRQGNPAIAYYDYDNCNLKYAHWDGTSREIEIVDNVGTTGSWNNYCMHISLDFNDSGNPAIAYYNGGSYWDLKYAHFDRGGWNRQTVYDDGWNGGWTRSAVLTFDSTGNPAISFREPYIGLRNAHWTGTSWNIQTVDSGYGTGACNSFLFDLQGSPTIAYYWQGVYQGDSELRYTHFSGTSWDIETVDSNVSDVSLAFDISVNPSISYYGLSKEDLKYACWDSSAWFIETVDSTGNVGLHSSLAYDSQGNPAISYYDATNGDLKFATRNPPAHGQSEAVSANIFSDNFSTDSGEWTYVETVYNVYTGEKCPGSAYRDPGNEYLVLTNSGYQAGVIWFNRDISSPFTAEFRYKAGSGTGADGLAFMFYKQKDYDPYNGGCLGFTTPPGGSSSSTPVPGYGIEFDNFNNGFDGGEGQFDDPSGNHIAIIKDSVDNHIKYVDDPRTEDDQWHNVKIIVGNSTIEVYVDSELLLRWEGKIDRTYGGFGFSGATGYYDFWHIIDDVSIVLGETIDNAISAYSFQYPIDDYVVTGYKFGQEVGSGRFHLGEDVLKPPGTPVYACADGIVKLANNKHAGDGNYGGLIIVEHTLPAGEKVCSLYGHLDHNKTLVGETEIVKKGETIGAIGREDPNINGNSTPHLHFGIRYGAFSGEYASDSNTTSGWYWAGYGKVDPNIKTNWWLKPSKLIREQTNFSPTSTPITTTTPEQTNVNAQSEIGWYDQEEGMQIAKSQNKPAMIFFYSDRCPASAKLAEAFADTRVINMSKNFVPIVGSSGLDKQYGIRYVPTIVFTNSQGMEIHRIVGYQDADTLVKEIQYAVMLSTTLDVPFFSQRDPAGRDKKLDHSTYSFGEYGCALTSAAMVAK